MFYTQIIDIETENPIAIKVYVEKNKAYEILGYFKELDGREGDDIIEQVCKGVDVYFEDLVTLIYDYMRNDFDEEFGEIHADTDFHFHFEKRREKATNLIGKRFREE